MSRKKRNFNSSAKDASKKSAKPASGTYEPAAKKPALSAKAVSKKSVKPAPDAYEPPVKKPTPSAKAAPKKSAEPVSDSFGSDEPVTKKLTTLKDLYDSTSDSFDSDESLVDKSIESSDDEFSPVKESVVANGTPKQAPKAKEFGSSSSSGDDEVPPATKEIVANTESGSSGDDDEDSPAKTPTVIQASKGKQDGPSLGDGVAKKPESPKLKRIGEKFKQLAKQVGSLSKQLENLAEELDLLNDGDEETPAKKPAVDQSGDKAFFKPKGNNARKQNSHGSFNKGQNGNFRGGGKKRNSHAGGQKKSKPVKFNK